MSRYSVIGTTVIALAATLLVVGCTSAPSPKPTGKPDPTPTAAPTITTAPDPAAETRAAITSIVVRPEMLQFLDTAGTERLTLSYDADAQLYVDLFTDLLGAAPAIEDTPGGNESQPTTTYSWDGFELRDDHENGGFESDMNVSVMFSAPALGPRSISVATIQGFKPGDDLRWLATYMDEPFVEDGGFNQIQAEHGPPIGEQQPGSPYSNSNSVSGQNLYRQDGTVIFAPWNFGIGHV